MKLWKKILLALFVVVLLTQIPFVYNRYRFGQLSNEISELQARRIEAPNPNFTDYTGVIHVHTSLGGHSTGTFTELINAAQANRLDFVMMTEHIEELYDTSALTLHGFYNGVLFVNGQEVSTATDRFLQLPGDAESNRADKLATIDYLQKIRANDELAIVAYPEKSKTFDADFDGIEVFNLYTNAQKINPFLAFFDVLWSYHGYSELVLAKYIARPDDNLRQFDELTKTRKLTATAGADAHSNIGYHLFGDDAQHKFINIKIDSYETIFRLVRNHVLLEKDKPFSQENLLAAIKNGRSYIAFDVLSDAKGFAFTAEDGAESKTMGDEIALSANTILKAFAPLPARFVIFKNGEKVFEARDAAQITFPAQEKGTYRAEVYLDSFGEPFDKTPWIISNPIYVR